MKQFSIEGKSIFYEDHLNGGGDDFGIKAFQHELVSPHIKKGKIVEMCSGPAFIGFYLNFIGLAEDLYLIDINDENRSCVEKTIKSNQLTNTHFIHSDVFKSFDTHIVFDTIVSNPPMFKKPSNDFYYENNEYLLAIDEDWKFHKEFFGSVEKYMDETTRIIFVENYYGMSLKDVQNLISDTNLIIEDVVSTNGTSDTFHHSFYTIILKIKNTNNKELQKLL